MITVNADRSITFKTFMPKARNVSLLGDFTDWTRGPVTMTREDTGWWSATVAVRAGDHEFTYLIDDDRWLADFAAHGVRLNEFGSWVSLLSVGSAQSARRAA